MNIELLKQIDLPLSQSVLDDIPLPLHVYQADGLLIATNHRADQFWGIPREQLVYKFNAFENQQLISPNFLTNFREVLEGQVVVAKPALIDTANLDVEDKTNVQRWVGAIYFPFRDKMRMVSHVVIMNIDFTDQIEHGEVIYVDDADDDDNELQDPADPTMSIIQFWDGILIVPLTGWFDSQEAMQITKQLLEAIVRYRTRIVLLDITKLRVDTRLLRYLLSLERACRLLNSEVALTGVSTRAAQIIANLEVTSPEIVIKTNLRSGVAWAFNRLGFRIMRNSSPLSSTDLS